MDAVKVRRLLLLLVPVVLLVGYNVQRGREVDQLRECVVRTEGDIAHLVAKADAAAEYASPQLTAAGTPERVRASLEALVTGTVAGELPVVRADRRRCEARFLLGGRGTRTAYLAYLDARIDVLQRATTDLDALHADVPERAGAAAALRDAFPDGSVTLASP